MTALRAGIGTLDSGRSIGQIARNQLRAARVTIIALSVVLLLVIAGAAVANAAPTYVERGGFQTYLQHPRLLSFSVNGDLKGLHLRWRHWGGGFAIAHGDISERNYPTNSFTTVAGAIKLDRVSWCDGDRYYTRAVFYPYGPTPFRAGPIRLFTPCNGG